MCPIVVFIHWRQVAKVLGALSIGVFCFLFTTRDMFNYFYIWSKIMAILPCSIYSVKGFRSLSMLTVVAYFFLGIVGIAVGTVAIELTGSTAKHFYPSVLQFFIAAKFM
jgi:hypothetical protein